MFFAYIVRDVVEIEPVYFPSTHKLTTTTTTSAAVSPPPADGRAANAALATSATTSYTLSFAEIVQHRITEMYVGKVLPGKGLCVALIDVLGFTDSEVNGPSGAAWLTATFSLCVFAPRPGTRLRATIVDQDASGIHLTIDFFSAFPFLVPASELIPGSVFDSVARQWSIPVEAQPGAADDAPLVNYYGFDEVVVVKVLQCTVRLESEVRASYEEGRPLPLMSLVGSFAADGLGPVAWFEEEVEEADEVPGEEATA